MTGSPMAVRRGHRPGKLRNTRCSKVAFPRLPHASPSSATWPLAAACDARAPKDPALLRGSLASCSGTGRARRQNQQPGVCACQQPLTGPLGQRPGSSRRRGRLEGRAPRLKCGLWGPRSAAGDLVGTGTCDQRAGLSRSWLMLSRDRLQAEAELGQGLARAAAGTAGPGPGGAGLSSLQGRKDAGWPSVDMQLALRRTCRGLTGPLVTPGHSSRPPDAP